MERFRVRMPAPEGPAAAALAGAFGFGVFAMTRKQMLGIRDRAEAANIAAGIAAEFTGRWDERAVEAEDATAAPLAETAAPAAEAADGTLAETAAPATEVADVPAATAKKAVKKAARKAAPAADEPEPTV